MRLLKGRTLTALNVITIALIGYLLVLIVCLFLPAAEGYNHITWKLLIGQVYALPVFIVLLVLLLFRNYRIRLAS